MIFRPIIVVIVDSFLATAVDNVYKIVAVNAKRQLNGLKKHL